MKKHILIIIGIFIVSLGSTQELPPNILGVRGGINFSSASQTELGNHIYKRGSRKGFNFGISYQRLLMRSEPVYIETGLYISEKGFSQNVNYEGYAIRGDDQRLEIGEFYYKTNLLYLQIPALINYHFIINNKVRIEAYGGIYAAYGIGGRTMLVDVEYRFPMLGGNGFVYHNKKVKSFDNSVFKKLDFGVKFGVGATFSNIHISAGYELGTVKSEGEYYIDYRYNGDTKYKGKSKLSNKNWIIQIGYSIPLYPNKNLKNNFNRIYPLVE
jgi:hypothetical protein